MISWTASSLSYVDLFGEKPSDVDLDLTLFEANVVTIGAERVDTMFANPLRKADYASCKERRACSGARVTPRGAISVSRDTMQPRPVVSRASNGAILRVGQV